MNNSLCLKYWQNKAFDNPTIKTSKVSDINDFSDYDKEFILKFANNHTRILDLAAGTGITLNKYYENVKYVRAVEKFPEFTKFIVQSPNVEVINDDILNYSTNETFDIVLLFGVVHYFSLEETKNIYKKCKTFLDDNGVLLIKQQFATFDDLEVKGFSKELSCDYYSQYRNIDNETKLLNEIGFKTQVVDIYPKECNRWENTHFYAIIAKS